MQRRLGGSGCKRQGWPTLRPPGSRTASGPCDRDARRDGPAVLLGALCSPGRTEQGRDAIRQPVAAQVDELCVLAAVQKVNLQRQQPW